MACQRTEEARQRASDWGCYLTALFVILSASAGIAIGVFVAGKVSALRSIGVGMVGLVFGAMLGSMIGPKIHQGFVQYIQGPRWRARHPELPNVEYPAVRMAVISKRRETDGQVNLLSVLECQCDAYADVLLQSFHYREPPEGYSDWSNR
jgi:hypothetical protein